MNEQCKYCHTTEEVHYKEMCVSCFQTGAHHPWWIKPVAFCAAVLFAIVLWGIQ